MTHPPRSRPTSPSLSERYPAEGSWPARLPPASEEHDFVGDSSDIDFDAIPLPDSMVLSMDTTKDSNATLLVFLVILLLLVLLVLLLLFVPSCSSYSSYW